MNLTSSRDDIKSVNNGEYNISKFNFTMTNNTVNNFSLISTLPNDLDQGIKYTRSNNIKLIVPSSPIFSVDVVILPPTFTAGQNNTVIANVFNYGNETAYNTTATITELIGLTIYGNLTQEIGILLNGSYKSVSWEINPSTSQDYKIIVNANSTDLNGTSYNDSDTETMSSQQSSLSYNIDYNDYVHINENDTINVTITNEGNTQLSNIEVSIVPVINMSILNQENQTIDNLAINESKIVVFDVEYLSVFTNQFKIEILHNDSSYYQEILNDIETWIDITNPNKVENIENYMAGIEYVLINGMK